MPPRHDESAGVGDQDMQGPSPWYEDDALPLVIVSGHGRHTAASRRIVRAQAARASAAQSRETRARNREDRQSRSAASPSGRPPIFQHRDEERRASYGAVDTEEALQPMAHWVVHVMGVPTGAAGSYRPDSAVSAHSSPLKPFPDAPLGDHVLRHQALFHAGEPVDRQLPITLPRGFAVLRERGALSDACQINLSRAACFDFGSPGGQQRFDNLLSDIVRSPSDSRAGDIGHILRIGCFCVTLYQGQRVDGLDVCYDTRYNRGLEAAWKEAVSLEPQPFETRDATEAVLWAMMILNVTAAPRNTIHPALPRLLADLQIDRWDSLRALLLRYIFPVSILDQQCRALFDVLRGGQLV